MTITLLASSPARRLNPDSLPCIETATLNWLTKAATGARATQSPRATAAHSARTAASDSCSPYCSASARHSRRIEQSSRRPHRHGAHQRRGMVELFHDHRTQPRIARIADGDEHIAQEARMADALDRTAGETGAEPRVVEPGEFGERRRREIGARRAASPRGRGGRICSTGRRRDNRRSRRCDCPSRRGTRPRYGPCARSSDRKCSGAHRDDRAPERPASGRRRDRRGRRRNDPASGAIGRELEAGEDRAEKQP